MATSTSIGSVVVGIDGSEDSRRALDWAIEYSAAHHRRLTLVHAYEWPVASPLGTPDFLDYADVPAAAETLVREETARARVAEPTVDVNGELTGNAPAAELIERSRSAGFIVVGHRGRGGFAGLLLGSVGVQVSAHAHCPVVIVKPRKPAGGVQDGPAAGQVVVGVDGSGHSHAALGFAFEEAAQRGVGLAAVHAWTGPESSGPGDMLPLVYDPEETADEERRVLAEAVAGWQEKFPEVAVRHLVVRGRPAKELVQFSQGAKLLVVGARGRGGFRGLLLGSVSQAAIHHAYCPVAVVR